jgi:hypothetical protein
MLGASQKIEELLDGERAWIEHYLKGGKSFVGILCPEHAGQPMTPAILDQYWSTWLTENDSYLAEDRSNTKYLNAVISCVGCLYGQMLVDDFGLHWVMATDQGGTDYAVYGFPGTADVLVYPINSILKRWQTRDTFFIAALYRMVGDLVDRAKRDFG